MLTFVRIVKGLCPIGLAILILSTANTRFETLVLAVLIQI
jgi:hypothetical protein